MLKFGKFIQKGGYHFAGVYDCLIRGGSVSIIVLEPFYYFFSNQPLNLCNKNRASKNDQTWEWEHERGKLDKPSKMAFEGQHLFQTKNEDC